MPTSFSSFQRGELDAYLKGLERLISQVAHRLLFLTRYFKERVSEIKLEEVVYFYFIFLFFLNWLFVCVWQAMLEQLEQSARQAVAATGNLFLRVPPSLHDYRARASTAQTTFGSFFRTHFFFFFFL